MAVEKDYQFDGPEGKASLLDLFDGRRQLILYRAFFEPGVVGWPEHACVGCSMVADQVAHPAHLNARDTTLAFASRGPQKDIQRLKARMAWQFIPWYTITDDFDKDFAVDEWHGQTRSYATATAYFGLTSLTTAATSKWVTLGTIWISPPSDVRRNGRIRRSAILKRRHTSGGGGTTSTEMRKPQPEFSNKFAAGAQPQRVRTQPDADAACR